MNAAAEYKATDWIFGGRASATYGESRTAGTDEIETSAEDAALFLRADRGFSPRVSTYALAGFEADHPKSIELRLSQELGVGYAWIDTAFGESKLLLRADLGFRVAEEYRYQYSRCAPAFPATTPTARRRIRRSPGTRGSSSRSSTSCRSWTHGAPTVRSYRRR